MKSGTKSAPSLRPRFQLSVNGDVALGPGKADLLELIDVTGSISEAASRMGMSYMRAWTLVRTMNNSFREPLVTMVRGGRSKGGSQLSDTGREVLTLYRRLESETRKTTRTLERSLIGHLRTP
ncbi:MAG: LysR family transcriptional regulator [Verrucomicrobiota bacterium]